MEEVSADDDPLLEARLADHAWYDIYLQAYNPATERYLVQVSSFLDCSVEDSKPEVLICRPEIVPTMLNGWRGFISEANPFLMRACLTYVSWRTSPVTFFISGFSHQEEQCALCILHTCAVCGSIQDSVMNKRQWLFRS